LRESVSEKIERIERGAMIKKYFYEEFGMESLKFKGTNEEFKGDSFSPKQHFSSEHVAIEF
jgi:hypothetical protein